VKDCDNHLNGHGNATCSGSVAEGGGEVVERGAARGESGGGVGRETSPQQQRKDTNDDDVRADKGKGMKGGDEKDQDEKGEDDKDSGDLDMGKQDTNTIKETEHGIVHLESDSLDFSELSEVMGVHDIDSKF